MELEANSAVLSEIIGLAPARPDNELNLLIASCIDTPLGTMLAISDEGSLYLLEFIDRRSLDRELEKLRVKTKSVLIAGSTAPILSIETELKSYFEGKLKAFKTPFHLLGSPFQQSVWKALLKIPYGETKSYREQASDLDKPTAARAVANANGANQLAIIIPCHRIIHSHGGPGGYAAGIHRKQWLINHEQGFKNGFVA